MEKKAGLGGGFRIGLWTIKRKRGLRDAWIGRRLRLWTNFGIKINGTTMSRANFVDWLGSH